ncbi:MAG: hypothetical protein RRC07_10955 [Anaerolineae bacterium]|nr:hypothetical protein [Anaerolineae bacterium]
MSNKTKSLAVLAIFLTLLAAGIATVRADDSFSEPVTGSPGNPIKGEVVESKIISSEPIISPSGQTAVAQGEVVENKTLSAATLGSVAGWTWNTGSRLTFYDHGQSEEVSGRSESSVDQPVYQLRVVGELLRNGGQVWTHPVTSCCNVTQTSTGDSPYYLGFNAFWESKGDHWLKETSSSREAHDSTVASKQF